MAKSKRSTVTQSPGQELAPPTQTANDASFRLLLKKPLMLYSLLDKVDSALQTTARATASAS